MQAGIYIHIPFCIKKCIYCDFYSIPNRENDIERFTNALICEIESTDLSSIKEWRFTTIYFGGGTPSLLEQPYLDKILNSLHRTFNLSEVTEITIEANPGEAPLQRLKAYRNLGINRLSVGFQTFQPDLLRFLSRIHTAEDCFSTFANAEKAGFTNINVDMIFNIPKQTADIWRDDLNTAIQLNPTHISAYSLTVERGTPLHQQVVTHSVQMPDEDTDILMFTETREILQSAGYSAYEISNFAKPGFECRHNLGYWKLQPYLGFGPSSHSYDLKRRRWKYSSLDTYLKALEKNESTVEGSEVITENDRFNELVFNGLRMKQGINLHQLSEWFSGDFENYLEKISLKWKELTIRNKYLMLTEEGTLLADEIAADLFITD